jgi:mono/diheme cytochrome c family protein
MKRYLAVVLAIMLVESGCREQQEAASIDQFKAGEQLYSTYCAHCHEIENGIGPHLTPKVLATRVTAQSLFNYNKRNMPYEAGNTLTEAQYWSVTAYLLIRHGLMEAETHLTPQNALEITLASPPQHAQ